MSAIARVAGEPVYPCNHLEELIVCIFLLSPGSTHGWHLDDPPYALILVLEPGVGLGGRFGLGLGRGRGRRPDAAPAGATSTV